MNLKELVRDNIWNLQPYSSARHEFEGVADIYLDANENPFDTGLNRYPDPLQKQLKSRISELKQVPAGQIFLGNGSDEAIDMLIRIFCRPGIDEVMILPPTYGMYKVSADICDVKVKSVSLNDDFQPDASQILQESSALTKILFLCSPNNPTGNLMERDEVIKVLEGFKGMVVVDEAYIDFSSEPSWTKRLSDYPNLIVLQTFSKAWGLAGIRLGMAFAQPEVIRLMNAVKPPYNINQLTQEKAWETLNDGVAEKDRQVATLLDEREKLRLDLEGHAGVLQVFPSEANFLLVKFEKHDEIFTALRSKGIVVRDRSGTHLCEQCLRITVGTAEENDQVIQTLKELT